MGPDYYSNKVKWAGILNKHGFLIFQLNTNNWWPTVRSRSLIFPNYVKLTDISQVCYFDTTTFTWHNPSIEPPLPSGEWFSWMKDGVNLLEQTNEVAIQIDSDYISQQQLTFMMKPVWSFKVWTPNDTADDTLNCSGRRSHSAINLNGKLLIFGDIMGE